MRVLALDIARRTGWAVVDDDHVVACGSVNLLDGIRTTGKTAELLDLQHVMQVQRLRMAVADLISTYEVRVVGVEREFGRGVGSRLLVSLYTAAHEAAYDMQIPALGIRISDWRIYIHGSAGKSTDYYKAAALEMCANAEVDVPDSDAAEAVLIAQYVNATAQFHLPPPVHRGMR